MAVKNKKRSASATSTSTSSVEKRVLTPKKKLIPASGKKTSKKKGSPASKKANKNKSSSPTKTKLLASSTNASSVQKKKKSLVSTKKPKGKAAGETSKKSPQATGSVKTSSPGLELPPLTPIRRGTLSSTAGTSPKASKKEVPIFIMDLLEDMKQPADKGIPRLGEIEESTKAAAIMELFEEAAATCTDLSVSPDDMDDSDTKVEPTKAHTSRRPSTAKSHAQVLAKMDSVIPDIFKTKEGNEFLKSPIPVPEFEFSEVGALAMREIQAADSMFAKEGLGKAVHPFVVVTPDKDRRRRPMVSHEEHIVEMPTLNFTPSCSSLTCDLIHGKESIIGINTIDEDSCCMLEPLPINSAQSKARLTHGASKGHVKGGNWTVLGLLCDNGILQEGVTVSAEFWDLWADDSSCIRLGRFQKVRPSRGQ